MKRNLTLKGAHATKGILTASMLLASMTSQADDFNLYYEATGTPAPVKTEAAANINKIIFEDGSIKIISNSGSITQLPSSNISRLFFSTEKTITAIEDVKDNGSTTDNSIHDLTGRTISTSAHMADLPHGIYIINGKKITK